MTRRELEIYRSCTRVSAVTIADALLWFLVYEARFLSRQFFCADDSQSLS